MSTASTHVSLLTALAEPQNEDAWFIFVRNYGDLIRGVARKQGLSTDDQQDVLQDVLTTLINAMQRFEYDPSKGRFRSFLRTITMRAIFARFRQNKRGGVQVSFGEDVDAGIVGFDELWEDEWRQHHLRRAMDSAQETASETDLAAFRAYVVEGRSAADVAEALGMSLDRVYQAKSRLLKLIRTRIATQINEEG